MARPPTRGTSQLQVATMGASSSGCCPPSSPLDRTVDHILHLCGQNADLALDFLLIANSNNFSPVVRFADALQLAQTDLLLLFREAPLLRVLQQWPETRCSPSGPLLVQSCMPSGSVLEGFGDQSEGLGAAAGSDVDTMIEFGPVRWRTADGQIVETDSWTEPTACSSPDPPPLLVALPTSAPGFVRVMEERDGGHVVLSARSFRQVMRCSLRLTESPDVRLECSGPAVAVHMPDTDCAGYDYVPCLRLPVWPADEFLWRQRVNDWPPPAAREDISRFGVHLVPTGCPGSATEESEWRLSFSRAEVIASWCLTDVQRAALVALKTCKRILGLSGRGLKSYFLKTTLLWLCQEVPGDQWGSVMRGVRAILDRLEEAVDAAHLPCFFWAEINLFARLTGEELAAIVQTISIIRTHMSRTLMTWCVEQNQILLGPLLEGPSEPLTERQLRLCLARGLIRCTVINSHVLRPTAPSWQPFFRWRIPTLLRMSAGAELERLHHYKMSYVQRDLCRAMLVVPDLAACRLTPGDGGGGVSTCDATPLMALLTESDLDLLLWDRAAVRAWCRQQASRPPAERPPGLPAELDSPRGLADLLLNTPLLVRALCESVPRYAARLQYDDYQQFELARRDNSRGIPTFAVCSRFLERLRDSDVTARLQDALGADRETASELAEHLTAAIGRQLGDPRFRAEVDRIRATLTDPWQLRRHVVTGDGQM